MAEVRGYRDLRVWQIGMDVVERVYALTLQYPSLERFGLSSQTQRAAVSVPANIAEGHTRDHTREYVRHVSIARASLAELETHIEIAIRLEYVQRSDVADVLTTIESLGRQLTALRESLLRRIDAPEQNVVRRPGRP